MRTPLYNVVVGLVISVILTRLTALLYYIPKATLGAVISAAMLTLVEWPEMIKVGSSALSFLLFIHPPTHPLPSFLLFQSSTHPPPTYLPVYTLGVLV